MEARREEALERLQSEIGFDSTNRCRGALAEIKHLLDNLPGMSDNPRFANPSTEGLRDA